MTAPDECIQQHATDSEQPSYVAIYRVGPEFQLTESVPVDDLAGMVFSQVLCRESGSARLYTLWMNQERFEASKDVLLSRLRSESPRAFLQWHGFQRQFKRNNLKRPLYKRVLTWSFLVQLAAALGVLHVIFTHFTNVSQWGFAVPRTAAVNTGQPLSLLENRGARHTLSLRNDSRVGSSDFELKKVFIRAADGTERPASVTGNPVLQSVEPGSVLDFQIDLPALPAGSYTLLGTGTHRNGRFWTWVGWDTFELTLSPIQVRSRLEVLAPRIVAVTWDESLQKEQAFVELVFLPGIDHAGLRGRTLLVDERARIRSAIVGDADRIERMQFAPGVTDHSGLKWTTAGGPAERQVNLILVLESQTRLPEATWQEIVEELQRPTPEFVLED